MSSPTPSEIRDLFSATGRRAEIRWDELVAWFVLMLRTERDAAFGVGQQMCNRAVRDITALRTSAETIAEKADLTNISVDSNRVLDFSRVVRRASFPQDDVILSGFESEATKLSTDLLNAGSAVENAAEILAAARTLLSTWADLQDVADGITGWLDALDTLPSVDSQYFANVAARTLMEASWELDQQGQRNKAQTMSLASLALIRLLRQSPVPEEVVDTLTFAPVGEVDGARSQAQNSGPYRVVSGSTDTLSAEMAPNLDDVIVMPNAKGESSVYLGQTRIDGYYHFSIAAGAYTVDMAAAVGPGDTVNITLSSVPNQPNMSVCSPKTLADAINLIAIPGVTAVDEAYTVRLDLSAPVSGPSGWLVFTNPSDPEIWSVFGFPSLFLTPQSMTAREVAEAYNAEAVWSQAEASETNLLSGSAWMLSTTEVSVARGIGTVSVSGNTVTMGQPILGNPWGEMQVGDECVLSEVGLSYTLHTITEIGDNQFTVDGTPVAGAIAATINPNLPDYDATAGFTFDTGQRRYRFNISDWGRSTTAVNLRQRTIDLSPRGHYDVGTFPFRIYQQTLAIVSKETTIASAVTMTVASLGSEASFSGSTKYGTAYQTSGSFTAVEARRNLVRVGDAVDYANTRTYVTKLEDGVATVSPGIPISANLPTLVFRNVQREAWDDFVDLMELPAFDTAAFEALVSRLQAAPSSAIAAEISTAASALVSDLQSVEAACESYAGQNIPAKAIKAILKSFRAISAWNFYDKITKGDLGVLTADPRDATREGYTARLSGDTGRELKTGLRPLERFVLESIGRARG